MTGNKANRMIQGMCRRPDTIAELNADPEKVFVDFQLSEEEKKALREGSPTAMGGVGVHPILQMHYVMARNPEVMERMSIREYAGLLQEE